MEGIIIIAFVILELFIFAIQNGGHERKIEEKIENEHSWLSSDRRIEGGNIKV